jgi:UDP-N-acetylmuramate dehydrogenase
MLNIKKEIELKNYTTFKIGGSAKYFTEVKNEEELKEALEYVQNNNLEFFILGGGSNILVSDKGFDGLVIKFLQTTNYKLQTTKIECWAGNSLASIISFAKNNNLTGLENLAGIPGTIGGAVRVNAGAYDMELCGIGDLVKGVRIVDSSSKNFVSKEFSKEECQFSYRASIFKSNPNLIITSINLELKKGDRKNIEQKIKEIVQRRTVEKPVGWVGSPGSFYKNPTVNNLELIKLFEKETGRKAKNGNIIPAYWLILKIGFREKKIGGVQLSKKNANFIINTGDATAQDVVILSSLIKQQVRDKFGIELQEEVQLVGF